MSGLGHARPEPAGQRRQEWWIPTVPWALRDVNCFHGLSDLEVEELTSLFEARVFRRGEWIIADDSPGDHIYLVKTGRVRLFLRDTHQAGDPHGRELTFDLVERGGIFGVSTLFGPGINGLRARAETESEVCIGGEDTLLRLTRWPQVIQNMVVQLGSRILRIEQELEGLASTSARVRLARVLHDRATQAAEDWPDGGRRITTPATHEHLAREIGVSRETVTRLLAKLTADGVIQREGRRLIVTDMDGLARIFQEDEA
jgi:CRP-like cAMP-binding protein